MRGFANRLRADESGFSLTELLVAMVIGSVVLWAMLTLMLTGFTKSAEVTDRAEASQNGRAAMDRITTLLGSQLCLDPVSSSSSALPPIVGGSDGSTITFYADLNGVSLSPDKYTLAWSSAAKTITETRYDGIGTLPNVTFSGTPTKTAIIARNIVQARDPATTAVRPIFRYYKFESDGSINTSSPMTTPILQASAGLPVQVTVAFKALPARTNAESRRETTIEGQASVGTPDPSQPNGGNCP